MFHWVIAGLIIANLIGAWATEDWEGSARATAMGLHKATGFTILVLSALRLAWRLGHRPPPFPETVGRLEARAARAVHMAFYMLMIGIPLSGWLMISAAGERRPFHWYGVFDLPYLPVQGNKAIGGLSHDAHEVLGYGLIALLALHLLGAIKHQLTDTPGFLARMGMGSVR